MRKELYYFRDQQGLEVDFLVPRPNAELWLVEAKATKTVRPVHGVALDLSAASPAKAVGKVNRGSPKVRLQVTTAAIANGVEALDVEQFVGELLGDQMSCESGRISG